MGFVKQNANMPKKEHPLTEYIGFYHNTKVLRFDDEQNEISNIPAPKALVHLLMSHNESDSINYKLPLRSMESMTREEKAEFSHVRSKHRHHHPNVNDMACRFKWLVERQFDVFNLLELHPECTVQIR